MENISLKRTLNPGSREKVAETPAQKEQHSKQSRSDYHKDWAKDKAQISFRIAVDLKEQIDQHIKNRKEPLSRFVIRSIEEQIKRDNAATKQKSLNSREIIKCVMESEQVSQGQLKEKLEMKSQSGVSQALQRDMRVSMVLRFLKVLNCKLVVEHDGDRYEVTE